MGGNLSAPRRWYRTALFLRQKKKGKKRNDENLPFLGAGGWGHGAASNRVSTGAASRMKSRCGVQQRRSAPESMQRGGREKTRLIFPGAKIGGKAFEFMAKFGSCAFMELRSLSGGSCHLRHAARGFTLPRCHSSPPKREFRECRQRPVSQPTHLRMSESPSRKSSRPKICARALR